MELLKKTKIGFIGAGNMAQALGNGMIQAGLVQAGQLHTSDPYEAMLETWKKWGSKTTTTNDDLLAECDILIFAVKPHLFATVVQGLNFPASRDLRDVLFISIMSGITLDTIEKALAAQFANVVPPVVRVMPNTPALVGAGAAAFQVVTSLHHRRHGRETMEFQKPVVLTQVVFDKVVLVPGRFASGRFDPTPIILLVLLYTLGLKARTDDAPIVEAIFKSVGICQQVSESQIDAFTGLHGSGPAYIYLAIEALSDGAVKMGIARPIATKFAAQTVMGSAKMVLETGRHPGSLKDDVCSPGGTTIEGVYALEKAGFRAALMSAVEAAAKKAQQQGS